MVSRGHYVASKRSLSGLPEAMNGLREAMIGLPEATIGLREAMNGLPEAMNGLQECAAPPMWGGRTQSRLFIFARTPHSPNGSAVTRVLSVMRPWRLEKETTDDLFNRTRHSTGRPRYL